MAEKMNANRTGLTVGIWAALLHALWAIVVAIGLGESAINWIMPLHFINLTASVFAFTLINAVLLIIAGFVGGYVMGWLFAFIWNFLGKR